MDLYEIEGLRFEHKMKTTAENAVSQFMHVAAWLSYKKLSLWKNGWEVLSYEIGRLWNTVTETEIGFDELENLGEIVEAVTD